MNTEPAPGDEGSEEEQLTLFELREVDEDELLGRDLLGNGQIRRQERFVKLLRGLLSGLDSHTGTPTATIVPFRAREEDSA